MPHYEDGSEVKVGDKVLITTIATVVTVTSAEEFCNASVSIEHVPPSQMGGTLTVNTKQLKKVD